MLRPSKQRKTTQGMGDPMSEQHIASVVNDYRRAFTWAARCSCGWEEFHSLAVVADSAAEAHMRKALAGSATVPITPVLDAIEASYRGRPCACCRGDDQASCPCEWPADPWGMTWCMKCRQCSRVHCACRKGF
jgi:hypothetical protein